MGQKLAAIGELNLFWLRYQCHMAAKFSVFVYENHSELPTIVPTKSDSDVIFCLQLLSKTLTLHSI